MIRERKGEGGRKEGERERRRRKEGGRERRSRRERERGKL